jgi:hypothetical protein
MSHSTVTVAANKVYDSIRISQVDGSANSFTAGAASTVSGFRASMSSLSGSDATSNVYAGVFDSGTGGPGTAKGIHSTALGLGTGVGNIVAGTFQVIPTTNNAFSWALQVTSDGVANKSVGLSFSQVGANNWSYGIDLRSNTANVYTNGGIRFPNSVSFVARRADDGADVALWNLNSANELSFTATPVISTSNPNMRFGTSADGFLAQRVDADGRFRIFSQATGAEVLTVTSAANTKHGGTATRGTTEGTNQVVLFNGTAPAGTLTNGVSFYSASGEARVMDAAGNSTLLSPHDDDGRWVFYSRNTVTGKVLKIDMERMMKFLNSKFGTNFVHEFVDKVGISR